MPIQIGQLDCDHEILSRDWQHLYALPYFVTDVVQQFPFRAAAVEKLFRILHETSEFLG